VSVRSDDLHGSVPDYSPIVLLIVDAINDLEYEGGEELLTHAKPMVEAIKTLKRSATEVGIRAVYVNDNFGKWRSDFKSLVQHCLQDGIRGKPLVELLEPVEEDYFVLKPKHSGFFSTTLEVLLKHLGAKVLILTGMAGNSCILFTAADAYMRDYEIIVPSDCVASSNPEDNRQALEIMRKVLKADTRPSVELDLRGLLREKA
jgi:nicotinamidase-related amidase